MVNFRELRIDSEKRTLIIDVSVELNGYTKNVYLSKIKIYTQDTYNPIIPTANSFILEKDLTTDINPETEEKIFYKEYRLELKDFDLIIPNPDLKDKNPCINVSLSENLFFIVVEVDGTPEENIPCSLDKSFKIGVTMDMCPIYYKIITQLREVTQTCQIPKNFINYFLQFKALQYAVESHHYDEAIDLYKRFFKKIRHIHIPKCACHGGHSL